MTRLSEIDTSSIQWVDGEKKPLGEKEIIVSSDLIASDFDGAVVDEDGYVDSNTLQQLKNSSFTLNGYDPYSSSNDNWIEVENYKIVGILPVTNENSKFSCTVAASDKDYAKYIKTKHGEYSFVVGPMPETKEDIRELVKYCYKEDSDIQYQLQNAVTYELDTINSVLKTMSKVFLYVGIGFAVFASLMLANFIATSISYKKQEIGILRAIGSRSNDVFRIFFSESFLIAMINFVLASIGVGVVTAVINAAIRKELGVLITILNFGVRQIALLFVVSIVVAALASFLPVKKIASKKPIDAIRNR
jgi:ABC-type antimicrobial peptide transport system permease subunit